MRLAINGGDPIRTDPFPANVTVGEEEKKRIADVIDSGCLSQYLGCWHDQFYGGTQVKALEREWEAYFGVKHAIAVNSCTSGLYCAVAATGVEPEEEIIVSAYTMCASATAPLIFNAIPVFADVEPDCFCLDPASVKARITPRTRAIIVVDLFGQPYSDEINKLAKKYNLLVIEDCAQSPGARLNGTPTGNLGDIGVFSLNYHKHIHSGEGGVIVTNDDALAEKCRLVRNHAEAVVEDKGTIDLVNMIGFNFRMTEIEATIARCQLEKLSSLNEKRFENVRYIEEQLKSFSFITPPKVRNGAEHAYYVHACKFSELEIGVSRNRFIDAVKAELPCHSLREAEGVKLGAGYVKPLYLQPMFQKRIAYGSKGYPFSSSSVDYSKGICPVAESLYYKELFTHEYILPSMSKSDIDDVIRAFEKVSDNINALK